VDVAVTRLMDVRDVTLYHIVIGVTPWEAVQYRHGTYSRMYCRNKWAVLEN